MSAVSSTSEPFRYAIGDVVAGKYQLEELLGEGGMGAVFRATNTTIDMPVALKLIRADLDRELLSGRLLQEARAAAKLAHPAIVRVFDVGKTALGDPFIVMELLHGESLATLLDREGRLTSARAVQLLLPIADALSVAHAKGFVHRDVKPDNVFIANDEEGQLQPKLVDFGIVKHERQDGDSKLTQVGSVLGSPDYMSPEQARGLDTIDQRSDVWSFAVVMYETIAGVAPFQAANYNALLRMIVDHEPPSLRDLSAADEELAQIVARGLRKEPSQRFPTMGLLGRALASWLHGQGITEDACGVSLEARWLSRPSDPAALQGASRSSPPDSWPEPPSGVRAIGGSIGHAPTLPYARHAQTPYTRPPAPASTPPTKQRLYWAAAAGGALVALLLGWLLLSAERANEHERATSPEPTLPPAAAPPVAVAPATIAPTLGITSAARQPEPQPAAGDRATAKPTAPTRVIGPSAGSGKKALPVAPNAPPAPPSSDLLSPY